MYVDLAFPIFVDKTFTYIVPPALRPSVRRGMRALAPLGSRAAVGFIVDVKKTTAFRGIKPIHDILDSEPFLSADLLDLAGWIADYYFVSLGEALKSIVVQGSLRPPQRVVSLVKENHPDINSVRLSRRENLILAELGTRKQISVAQLRKKTGIAGINSVLNNLTGKNIVLIGERRREKRERAGRTPDTASGDTELRKTGIILNRDQLKAVNAITGALKSSAYKTFLLHGVTGSGKTEVYIEAIKEVLNMGKTSIVLVPEISLTPQTVRRFRAHFGERVETVHSRISLNERQRAWRAAREGKCSVIIGARSAVFAPLKNLGLIVVDEEHETSYKQYDQTPRYNARDVATMRASRCGSVVVLGSATPSVESYDNALRGKYELLELPERIDEARLPHIRIVDMTQERSVKLGIHREKRRQEFRTDPVKAKLAGHKFEFGSISDLLKEKIEDRLNKKEGIILLQNRRGYSPFIECPDCGHVELCDHCNISLTYHAAKEHLRCHYCGMVKHLPLFCPECQSADIQYRGFGTQRVENEIAGLFPSAKLIRMDLDTTATKGSHGRLLKIFGQGGADILLGTQMVAKGLDFSHVTLVGVISADTQMLLPDFRSAERTFQLLTQVAGRAGRSTLAGEVVIQTFQPKNPTLQYVLSHSYKDFFQDELRFRKDLSYPPYSRLVLIEFKGRSESEVLNHVNKFAEMFKKSDPHFITLGPTPAAITKIKNLYRWHILIKSLKSGDPAGRHIHEALHRAVEFFRNSPSGKNKNIRIIVDIDPVGMM